ncbi:MAG: dihydroorotase [Rhodovibrionaceae bacterium]|nr:dihydroorotase [Rhodovibrionaceae bacterium]
MAERYDLIVAGGQVATPGGLVETDVGVRAGRVAAIGDLAADSAAERLEAHGLTVLPGVIDTQVHFREPGLEHKEDLESGTRAAAMGGVTTVFEMPNTSPSTLSAEAIEDKLNRARGRAWVDHAFFMGAAAENVQQLPELERLPGVCGVKIFMGSSTGSLLVDDDETLAEVLRAGCRRVAVHAEDDARLRERLQLVRDGASVDQHPVWRDEETAIKATQRLMRLARQAGRPVHVLHVTTAEEMEILAQHKDLVTVEVTPQHLTLAAPECYEEHGTFAQMNPPIRDARHRDGLWRGVAAGVVDVVGSDHAPHTREEKAQDYPRSPSGMPGVQTLLPLLLDHMNAGRLTLQRLIDLTSAGAQRIYQIAGKGRIALGYDADFTLVDLGAEREITGQWLASKCGWSPFEGRKVKGWPMVTVVRGEIVMHDGELRGSQAGAPVRFVDTMPGGLAEAP